MYRIGNALGDQVCLTTLLPALRAYQRGRIVVITNHGEIFFNNPHIWKLIDLKRSQIVQRWVGKLLGRLRGDRILNFLFENPNRTFEDYIRNPIRGIPIAQVYSLHFPFPLDLRGCSPEVFLTSEEREHYAKKFTLLPERFAVIQSQGKTSYTPNKEWDVEEFQKVVNRFSKIPWVQLGLHSDARLNGVVDLRGQTKTFRELAFVIERADFVFCLEGLFSHLAAAVGTPSIVLFSGFHAQEMLLYRTTIPVSRVPQVSCAPCGLTTPCPVPGKPCTGDIHADDVICKLELALRRHSTDHRAH